MVWTNGSKKSKRNSQHSIISFKFHKHPEGERENKLFFSFLCIESDPLRILNGWEEKIYLVWSDSSRKLDFA